MVRRIGELINHDDKACFVLDYAVKDGRLYQVTGRMRRRPERA